MAGSIDKGSDPLEAQLQRYADVLARHVVALFLRDSQGALESWGTGLLVSTP